MTFDPKVPTVQLLGRYQPWQYNHMILFDKAHTKTGQVCIMIRDLPLSDDYPYSFDTICDDILEAMAKTDYVLGEDYMIMGVPNIIDSSVASEDDENGQNYTI